MGGCEREGVREIGPLTSNDGSNNEDFISVYSTPSYAPDDTKTMAIRPLTPPPLSPPPNTNIDPYPPAPSPNNPHPLVIPHCRHGGSWLSGPFSPPNIVITAVNDDDAQPSFLPYPAPSIHRTTTIEHSPPFLIAGNPTVVSAYPHEATTMFHCAGNAYLPSHLIPSPCHHRVSVEWHISSVWEYEAAHRIHARPRQCSSSPSTISPPPYSPFLGSAWLRSPDFGSVFSFRQGGA